MMPGRIDGATRTLGAPHQWGLVSEQPVHGLPIRDERFESLNSMTSAWFPSADEIAAIAAGAPVYLRIVGERHPVVALFAGEVPE